MNSAYPGYTIGYKVLCNFMARLSWSTLAIGPWTYNLSLVFVKLIVVKEKLGKFSFLLCSIKVVGNAKELSNLGNI